MLIRIHCQEVNLLPRQPYKQVMFYNEMITMDPKINAVYVFAGTSNRYTG